ncbi:hypothetical protein Verru16b_01887 [Lacunisphaera limnophila]|uniref:Uncharacterized protein n=1 Tax=Lacunisphaera limnophila TaxID=1838286 RepID=A0A1D8AV84_9BACT|nr:hypothetical protein [Lacunisphaera limnophila]AOS44818.1 hypothetical protein Verru16b_01887 [Lacunisphaera limnophila]
MNYFPHQHLQPSARPAVRALASVRQALNRDILWNRPVFKAPALANPRIAFDPLPFTATRLTQLSARRD